VLGAGVALALSVPLVLTAAGAGASSELLVSLRRPALASSVRGPGYAATEALDTNTSTRWESAPGPGSQWLRIDFGRVQKIDRVTLQTRIDRYVTMHDCGTILHPAMVDGQVRGGFAQAVGAALYEEYAYAPDGSFLTGTFADYLLPTVAEIPEPVILHMQTPSPFTPLGSKGVGEGNCMSTPVCIANAVADALGVESVELPIVPARLAETLRGHEPPAPAGKTRNDARQGDRKLLGRGSANVAASPEAIWKMLLDPATLQAVIPGCHDVKKISDTHFRADVTIGVGPVKGRYRATVTLSDLDEPNGVTLAGSAEGALGFGSGKGRITLAPQANGETSVGYTYEAEIGGKVASIGGRLLDGAARVIIGSSLQAWRGRQAATTRTKAPAC